MSGLYQPSVVDSSRISPMDAAATLRSLRRRFASVLVPPGDDERPDDAVHRRPAAGGLSAVEHAAWVTQALPELGEALRRALIETDPSVEVPPLDTKPPVEGGELSSAEAVARLGATAEALADAISNVPGTEWTRAGRANGAAVTTLDIARGAVELSIHHLRAAEAVVRQVLAEIR